MNIASFFNPFIEDFYKPAIQIFHSLPVSVQSGIISIVSMTFICLSVKTIRRLS